MSSNNRPRITKWRGSEIYHYYGIDSNKEAVIFCGQHIKEESILEAYISIIPEGRLCKKCEKVINDN